jgi:hypothetical protein
VVTAGKTPDQRQEIALGMETPAAALITRS